MGSETPSFQWEATKVSQVNGLTAKQVWSVVSDFCNVHEWFPTLDTCHKLEGTDGEPGLIRYCASTTKTKTNEDETEAIMWAKERLVRMDPIERCLSYEIVENNVGFGSYVATVKVLQTDGEDRVCRIEWSYVSDPVDGWKKEDLESYVEFCLNHMVTKMETNL